VDLGRKSGPRQCYRAESGPRPGHLLHQAEEDPCPARSGPRRRWAGPARSGPRRGNRGGGNRATGGGVPRSRARRRWVERADGSRAERICAPHRPARRGYFGHMPERVVGPPAVSRIRAAQRRSSWSGSGDTTEQRGQWRGLRVRRRRISRPRFAAAARASATQCDARGRWDDGLGPSSTGRRTRSTFAAATGGGAVLMGGGCYAGERRDLTLI
jgi:hypothetical protein